MHPITEALEDILYEIGEPINSTKLNELIAERIGLTDEKSFRKAGYKSRSDFNRTAGLWKSSLKTMGAINYEKPKYQVSLTERGKKIAETRKYRKEIRESLARPWDFVDHDYLGRWVIKREVAWLADQVAEQEYEIEECKKQYIREYRPNKNKTRLLNKEELRHFVEWARVNDKLGYMLIAIYRKLEYELENICDQCGRYQGIKVSDLRGSTFERINKYLQNVCFFQKPPKVPRERIRVLKEFRDFFAHNPSGHISEESIEKNDRLKKLAQLARERKDIGIWESKYSKEVFIWPKVDFCYHAVWCIEEYLWAVTETSEESRKHAPYYFDEDFEY